MKLQRLSGIIERAFRRFWRRYIYDAMPAPPDPKHVLALMKCALPPNHLIHPSTINVVLDDSNQIAALIEPHGEYICGCAWRGYSIPHYCQTHPWACPVFEVHGQHS